MNRIPSRTFEDKNNNIADSLLHLNFNVYIDVDNRERARAKEKFPISLEEKRNNFIYNDGRKKASSCGKFMQHLETCLLIAEADRVLYHLLIVLTFFLLDVENEIQLLQRMFYYSWLVCLLGFSLRDAPLVGNPNSQSIVSTSPCLMRRIEKSQAILALFGSFQDLHLTSPVFLQVLRFPRLLKNQHFQIPIQPGIG